MFVEKKKKHIYGEILKYIIIYLYFSKIITKILNSENTINKYFIADELIFIRSGFM